MNHETFLTVAAEHGEHRDSAEGRTGAAGVLRVPTVRITPVELGYPAEYGVVGRSGGRADSAVR
ncbi:MAG TPA: hypothetical protein VI248_06540 [Kineosporiaceae bacterium]